MKTNNGRVTRGTILATVMALVGTILPALATEFVVNGSFEANTYVTFPGQASQPGNGAITGWTLSNNGNGGLNPAGGNPFADNGIVPDGANVCWLQGGAATHPTLSQTITGLTTGQTYRLSLRCNARSDGAHAAIGVSVGGETLSHVLDVTPVDSGNVHTRPYYPLEMFFTATNTTASLVISNDYVSADNTLLVDAVTITEAATSQVTVVNGNFEYQAFTVNYGVADNNGGAIFGWTLSDPVKTGLNPWEGGQNSYTDNGIPEGTNALFMISSATLHPSISQTIYGLTPGLLYRLSLRCNARSDGAHAALGISLDGTTLCYLANIPPVESSGHTKSYYPVETTFVPASSSALLIISNDYVSADNTLLVDAVTITRATNTQAGIVNGGFEYQTFTVNNGVAASAAGGTIFGWTLSNASSMGLLPVESNPFGDNGIPEGTNALFMQGSVAVSQTITALTTGQTYRLSLRCNARAASTHAAIDVSVGGAMLCRVPDVTAVEAAGSHTKPYYPLAATFTATNTAELLVISNCYNTGDNTLLVDALDLTPTNAIQVDIINGSFEYQSFSAFYGIANNNGGAIFGWTLSDATKIGLNPSTISPFGDNGLVPDGTNVCFLQKTSAAAADTWISQTLLGLTPGRSYNLALSYNSRAEGGTVAPAIAVLVDGTTVFSRATVTPVESSGNHTLPYYSMQVSFTPAASTTVIRIANNNTTQNGDSSLLVDNVRVWPTPPPKGTVILMR